ncbi:nucleolar protein 58-like [Palaemon carinicauda]|uniref:nucleolar protein 58-like n=1 Tax=Palaemon carinicauda TaxID=392227 RepID=UPI0035B68E26
MGSLSSFRISSEDLIIEESEKAQKVENHKNRRCQRASATEAWVFSQIGFKVVDKMSLRLLLMIPNAKTKKQLGKDGEENEPAIVYTTNRMNPNSMDAFKPNIYEGVDILLGNEVGGPPFVPCPIVVEKPLKYSPTTGLEKDYPSLFPSSVTTRSTKKEVAAEEEGEIEGAMDLEDLFSKDGDSLDSTQEEKSRVSRKEEEWQASGQEDKKEEEIEGTMNLEDLFSKEENSLDITQEEKSQVGPSEEEQQTSGQEDKEKMDLEKMNLKDLFSKEKDSLDDTQEENSILNPSEEEWQTSGRRRKRNRRAMSLEDLFSEEEE